MTISDLVYYIRSRPVNGLVCCTRYPSIAVCNPTTRQIVKLSDVTPNGRDMYTQLGYDPVEDQYKVLCVMMFDRHDGRIKGTIEQEHLVCTLKSGQQEWRKIETIDGDPYDMEDGIYIDGAIYYVVGHTRIARFDVRSEKMTFIEAPNDDYTNVYRWTLINHQGKLAGVEYNSYCHSAMGMWVLQDVEEKQEWSSVINCDVPSDYGDLFTKDNFVCIGEIHTNEVTMVSICLNSSKLFCVYYFDVIRESTRRCEVDGIADSEFRRIQGIGKHARRMLCFPGHIENIRFF